jgi:hypothetical protein
MLIELYIKTYGTKPSFDTAQGNAIIPKLIVSASMTEEKLELA